MVRPSWEAQWRVQADDDPEITVIQEIKRCGKCGRVAAEYDGKLVCPRHGELVRVPQRATIPDGPKAIDKEKDKKP